MNNALKVRSAVLLALALSACPKVPDADPLEAAPGVVAFTSSASEVSVGDHVTLTWKVTGATVVKIEEASLGAVSGVSGNEGTVDVAITGESLFVLTARNTRGAADSAVVAVRVGAAQGELFLTALPSNIEAGQSTTIAWSAPGASAVTLIATPGGPVNLGSQVGHGSVVVSPTATTTYTLTAGVRTATTRVSVAPTLLSFNASSLSADAGATVTLSWATANATRVQLSAPGRGDLVDETDLAKVASGSFDDTLPTVVDPGQFFPYELTVTGPNATIVRSLVVSIAGNPAVLSFAAPKYVRAGSDGGVTLAWTTTEADALSMAAGTTEFYRAPSALVRAGQVQVAAPTTDTTFTVTATNSRGGSATKTASIDVVGAPSITLTATPPTATVGQDIVLSWSGTDVRNVTVTDPAGNVVFHANDVGDTGSLPTALRAAQNTTWRIVADNGAGDVVAATASVTISGTPTFTQTPTGALRSGQQVTLSWATGETVYGLPHNTIAVNTTSTGFDDISMTGTSVAHDDVEWSVAEINPIDFRAPFFGRVVGDRVWVATNGYLSFSPTNNINYSDVALPSAKLETFSIAPAWDWIVLSAPVKWQVKSEPTGKVLIVQWTGVEMAAGDVCTFQAKLHSTGQVDLEYQTWAGTSGNAGVQGSRANEGFALPVPRASGLGVSFFAPVTATATLDVKSEAPLTGYLLSGTQLLPVTHAVGSVITPRDLSLSEALVSPAATVGANGRWFEFFNARDTAIDLTGWSFDLADGGTAPLSGSVPARGVLVVGVTTDPALNDDAGVQVAVTGFEPGPVDAGSFTFGRAGALSSVAWLNPTQGVSQVIDFGPYRLNTDTTGSAHAVACAPTTGFGNAGQLGTPGSAGDCGFGYTWREIKPGFFDISTFGAPGLSSSFDSVIVDVDLAAAPFPFFGANRAVAHVSTNGFVSFGATASATDTFSSAYPSTSDTNLLIAAFADDLTGSVAVSTQIFSKRVAANVDPSAAAPHWIFQWQHFRHSGCGDDLNFQVKLFDDGASEIHFAEMNSATCSTQYGSGASANTWLENATGTQALVINAISLTPGISPRTSFRFSPR